MKKIYIGLVLALVFLGTLVLLYSLNVTPVVATSSSSSGDECQDDIDCGEPYCYGDSGVISPYCVTYDPYRDNYCDEHTTEVCEGDEVCVERCHYAACEDPQ